MTILITSGGTQVPIDSVRHIGNMSSGKFGADLGAAFLGLRHKVIFFRQKHSASPLEYKVDLTKCESLTGVINHPLRCQKLDYKEVLYTTYNDYATQLPKLIRKYKPDYVISAAAVSDYGVVPVDGKISSAGNQTLTLIPVPKVLPLLKSVYKKAKIIGFKLLAHPTKEQMREAAMKTLKAGHCVMVAANDIDKIRKGNRSYTLFFPDGSTKELKASPKLAEDFAKLVLTL